MLGLRCSSLVRSTRHSFHQAFAAVPRATSVKRVYCSKPPPSSSRASVAQPIQKKPGDVSLAMGLAAGGFAGVLSALSGVGGGMVLVPVVAKMTNFSMQTVNGTCLAGLTAGAAVGAFNYSQADACNYPLALLTSIPAIAFARLGVMAAHHVSSRTLSTIVGYGMLASVPFIVLKNSELLKQFQTKVADSKTAANKPVNLLDLQYYHTDANSEGTGGQPKNSAVLLEAIAQDPLAFATANLQYIVAGVFSGFIAGFCGVGASMVTTTYLTTGTDMPQSLVIGTSLVSVLPMSMFTSYYYYKSKSIHVPTALKIGGALTMGIYCTSKFILEYQKVPEDVLRAVLATAIGAASIAMIRRSI